MDAVVPVVDGAVPQQGGLWVGCGARGAATFCTIEFFVPTVLL